MRHAEPTSESQVHNVAAVIVAQFSVGPLHLANSNNSSNLIASYNLLLRMQQKPENSLMEKLPTAAQGRRIVNLLSVSLLTKLDPHASKQHKVQRLRLAVNTLRADFRELDAVSTATDFDMEHCAGER